jgi:SAM-dependent methyltransferase
MTTPEQLASQIGFPTHRDRDFFMRVYRTERKVYAERLRAIGFEGRESVLDAACGFGQWALTLAGMNGCVHAFDVSALRVEALRRIAATQQARNLHVCRGTLDAVPYANGSFDALFCYGAVFFTDYRRSFVEFARVLRPGGLMYFTANAFGWYLRNLLVGHNPSRDFSPRRMAIGALYNTLRFAAGRHAAGAEIVMSPDQARRAAERSGLRVIGIGADGELSIGSRRGRSFFMSHYGGFRAVYEVLCEKR